MDISKTDNATDIRKPTRKLAGVFTVIIWLVYLFWRYSEINFDGGDIFHRRSPLLPFCIAVVPAYAFALISVLFSENRHRYLTVLRPNFGRLYSAFILAGITPFYVLDWVPVIPFGYAYIIIGLVIYDNVRITEEIAMYFGTFLLLIGFWYLIASLLISGISSRWWRFGGFCLMFWAVYTLQIILFGVHHFRL